MKKNEKKKEKNLTKIFELKIKSVTTIIFLKLKRYDLINDDVIQIRKQMTRY